jgi:hypothetical protein
MFNDEELDLSEDERAAFAALPRERAPGDLLEERVVRQLRTNGFFSRANQRSNIGKWALRAAAAVFIFAAGALTDRALANRTESAAPISPARAAEMKTAPVQRTEPSQLAQLELWI